MRLPTCAWTRSVGATSTQERREMIDTTALTDNTPEPRATTVKVRNHIKDAADNEGVMFWCQGCKCAHQIITPRWTWNGRLDHPTFTPSILVQGGLDNMVCHSFVTDGKIQYLGDSTHYLAGKTVDLMVWPPKLQGA